MSALVLNIDDNEPGRYARSQTLRSAGFEVFDASNGADALRLAKTQNPAVILLDIRLPDMSGLEVCRALKQSPETARIPVISVTAYGKEREIEAIEAGATAYLTEPIDPELLIATVRMRVREREADQDRERTLRQTAALATEELSRNRVAVEILESISEAFIAFNSDLRVTYVNAEAERLLGRRREELLGRAYEELDPASIDKPTIENYRRALREQCVVTFENHYEPWDRWFDVKASPARNGVAVYFRDITEEKRTRDALEDAKRRFVRLLDSNVIGLATASATGIHYANDEFLRVIGYSREELEAGAADWTKATPPEHLERDLRAIEELRERGECTPFEKDYIHRDGTRIPVLIGAAAINEEPLEWVAFIVDISSRKRAEEALKVSRQRLQLAAEAAEIGAWDIDLGSGTIHADPLSCSMFGMNMPSPKIDDWVNAIHPEDRARVKKALDTSATTGCAYEIEHRTLAEGRVRWLYAKARALRDSTGQPTRMVGIVLDTTARKESEERVRDLSDRLDFHMNNSPVAVIEYDSEFTIARWGGDAERMFGWTATEIVGKRFHEFHWIHDEDMPKVQAVAANLLKGAARVHCQNRNYCKDGRVVQIDWYNSARYDDQGRMTSLLCLGVDVTARTEAEQELRKLARELRASNEDLQQFAYAVSHDLQEPLRNVNAYSELLNRRYGADIPEAGRELLAFMSQGVTRMQKLVGDLLEFSRVGQANGASSGQVRLEGALRFAVSNLSHAIAETQAEVTHDALPEVPGDGIRLCQLFQNLLGNAIKYRQPGVPPRIHVSANGGAAGAWHVTVADNGIGIDPAYQDQVFGVFKRLHGEEIPGTGIGLAICKRIVERHGGRIWVESQPGKGSEFHFTLAGSGPVSAA